MVLVPSREDAWTLLTQHTQSPNLIKHALAVEAAMRAYAVKLGGDVELWGVTGLIHDVDYEQHPTADEHPLAGAKMLEQLGWPEEIIVAIKGHATYLGVPRDTPMSRALFAVDELTGFIAACALVRPDKSIHSLKARSVRKKWKDKAFARAVSREDIEQGAAELGAELEDHIGFVIEAMRTVADEVGLAGDGSPAVAG